ncbi:DUF3558 domain-containing protein [Saccharothrix obliqua]|uniref:DUF3558 domain-containing protein n=1 Tax=Saccharothrix obliqua TaxID=2861747 RepID=UPI001C5FED88|nr:DUF3558 domain-containing protein [Saccharothrix obliqua]MBW4720749.1 DUF3558 domain-containing protein [Saccharothrix obliqua]
MIRTLRAIAVAGAAVAALAACSSNDVKGTPTATPGGGTTTTAKGGSSGQPDLDLKKYLGAPCTILTPAQQSELSTFREAKAEAEGIDGPTCTYQGKDSLANSTFKVAFSVKGRTFEEGVSNSAAFSTFRETKIAGYQAAVFDGADGKRNCNAAVRTSATEFVLIQATIGKNDKLNDGNACGTAEQVAGTVVANLKG